MTASNQAQLKQQIATKLSHGSKTDSGLSQQIADTAAHHISDLKSALTFRVEDLIVDKIGEALDVGLEKIEHSIAKKLDLAVDRASLAATTELSNYRASNKSKQKLGATFFAALAEHGSDDSEVEQANLLQQDRRLNKNLNLNGVGENGFTINQFDQPSASTEEDVPNQAKSMGRAGRMERGSKASSPYNPFTGRGLRPTDETGDESFDDGYASPEEYEPLQTTETLLADIDQKGKDLQGGGAKKAGTATEMAHSISGAVHERSQYQKILAKDRENLAARKAAAQASGQPMQAGSFQQGIGRRIAIRLGLRVVDRYANAIGRTLQKNIKDLNFWGMYIALGFAVIKDLIDAGEIFYGDPGLTGMVANAILSMIIAAILFAQGTFLRRQMIKILFYGYKYVICWLLEWIPIIEFFPAATVGILLMIYDAVQIRRRQLKALVELKREVKKIQKLERQGKDVPQSQLLKIANKLNDIDKIANS